MLDINSLIYPMFSILCNYISHLDISHYDISRYDIFLDLKKGIKNDQKGNT